MHDRMDAPRSFSVLALALLGASLSASAQEAAPLTPEELVAVEKVRPRVEAIFAAMRDPHDPLTSPQRFEASIRDLAALGADAGPFLAAELELPDVRTFNVVAYAMGLVDYPGGVAALRRACEVADREGTAYGRARKEWTIYGLALRGDPESVDLAVSGKSPVGAVEFMEGMRLLEIAAVLSAPASVPKLLDQLKRFDAAEELHPELDATLMALGAVGDRATVPAVVPFLRHKRMRVRAEAARALGRTGDPSSVDPLFEALKDPEGWVQAEAAIALYRIRPTDRMRDVLAALETTDDPDLRRWFYRTLASAGGEPMLEALRANARRPVPLDRTVLADALGELGSRKGLNALRANLPDPSMDVVLTSVRSIARIGGEGATDTLIALVGDRRRAVAQTAIELLTEAGVERAGPRIAGRLLSDFAAAAVIDPEIRTLVEKSCEALVRLRFAEPRADVREAASRQTDPVVVEMLVRTATLLDALAANGSDEAKWIAALGSGDEALRGLAVRRLGDLGTPRAAGALAAAFAKGPDPAAADLLAALGRAHPTAETTALLEKILNDPAWDLSDRRVERAWAAWALRRGGGSRATAALKASIVRRGGADWPVLVYYAQLAGPEALPVLRASKGPRLRVMEWYRGEEQSQLERLIVLLASGHSIAALDLPPDRLHLH